MHKEGIRFAMSLAVFAFFLLTSPLLFTTFSAYAASEQYLVADPDVNTLWIITPAGVRTDIYHFSSKSTHGVYDVTLDSSGNYIVTEVRESETDLLSKVTPSGQYSIIYTFPAGTYPLGVRVDSAGNYIVTERNPKILSKITLTGVRTVIYDFSAIEAYARPIGVTIDPSGNYIVTTEITSGIAHVGPSGLSRVTPTGVRTVIYTAGSGSLFGVGGVVYLALPPSAVTLSNPSEITETSIKLSWTACGDSDFKNCTIYRSTDQGSLGTLITTITNNSTTSYVATGLSADSTYYFKIRVYDAGSLYADSNQLTLRRQVLHCQ